MSFWPQSGQKLTDVRYIYFLNGTNQYTVCRGKRLYIILTYTGFIESKYVPVITTSFRALCVVEAGVANAFCEGCLTYYSRTATLVGPRGVSAGLAWMLRHALIYIYK